MRSICKNVFDFLRGIFVSRKKELPKIKKQIPTGYKELHFKCWLCTGHNEFASKKFTQERKFTIECSWCGVENVVTVLVSKS